MERPPHLVLLVGDSSRWKAAKGLILVVYHPPAGLARMDSSPVQQVLAFLTAPENMSEVLNGQSLTWPGRLRVYRATWQCGDGACFWAAIEYPLKKQIGRETLLS